MALALGFSLLSSSALGSALVSKLRVQGDYTLQDIVSSSNLSIIDSLRIIKRDRDMDRISFKKGARIRDRQYPIPGIGYRSIWY